MTKFPGRNGERVVGFYANALRRTLVAREPARHIDGEHNRFRFIDSVDERRERFTHRAAEPDPEQRVDQHVRLRDQLRGRFVARQVKDADCRAVQLREHERRILVGRFTRRQQDDDGEACLGQLAGDHETVAAVFALTAEDHDPLPLL